jgi:hypothetical protein
MLAVAMCPYGLIQEDASFRWVTNTTKRVLVLSFSPSLSILASSSLLSFSPFFSLFFSCLFFLLSPLPFILYLAFLLFVLLGFRTEVLA